MTCLSVSPGPGAVFSVEEDPVDLHRAILQVRKQEGREIASQFCSLKPLNPSTASWPDRPTWDDLSPKGDTKWNRPVLLSPFESCVLAVSGPRTRHAAEALSIHASA